MKKGLHLIRALLPEVDLSRDGDDMPVLFPAGWIAVRWCTTGCQSTRRGSEESWQHEVCSRHQALFTVDDLAHALGGLGL